jgi:hypothetical protein
MFGHQVLHDSWETRLAMSAATATIVPPPIEALRSLPATEADARPAQATEKPKAKSWLFNPWLDLLVIANVFWPLLIFTLFLGGATASLRLNFWMIYFLSTPHRWITLVLVFFDPDRYRQHARSFVGIAAGCTLLCAGAYMIWGLPGVYVLLAVDFLWNAWHFASQHAGILRIYGRMSHGDRAGSGFVEKLVVRCFLLFVLARLASLTLIGESVFGRHLNYLQLAGEQLARLDLLAFLLPLGLLVREFWFFRPVSVGRLAYILSVGGLYSLLLWSVHEHSRTGTEDMKNLALILVGAAAIFHSTEYLAIVSWTATRKKNPRGVLAYLAPRWAMSLVVFISLLALSALVCDTFFATAWLLLNLTVSFLHYAYDGIIWKARKPAARPVLG